MKHGLIDTVIHMANYIQLTFYKMQITWADCLLSDINLMIKTIVNFSIY